MENVSRYNEEKRLVRAERGGWTEPNAYGVGKITGTKVLYLVNNLALVQVDVVVGSKRPGPGSMLLAVHLDGAEPKAVAHVLHWSLECGDNVPLEDGVYTQGQGSLRMAYESIPDWTREWMLRAPIAGICDAWGIKRKSTLSAEFVRSDAPVLLLSGALDPVTPPSYAEAALDYLPNGHHFVFPGRAHDVGADPCARRLMSEFLAEPGTRPTDACFEGLGPMEFLTSVD